MLSNCNLELSQELGKTQFNCNLDILSQLSKTLYLQTFSARVTVKMFSHLKGNFI